MAPQQVEKIEFAPGNGRGSEAANPLDVVKGRAADRARLHKNDKVGKVAKLQKKTPKVLKSLDAKLKSAPVAAGTAGRARRRGIVREAWVLRRQCILLTFGLAERMHSQRNHDATTAEERFAGTAGAILP